MRTSPAKLDRFPQPVRTADAGVEAAPHRQAADVVRELPQERAVLLTEALVGDRGRPRRAQPLELVAGQVAAEEARLKARALADRHELRAGVGDRDRALGTIRVAAERLAEVEA